jgi:predicted RND superfamily exporter protein
MERLRGLIASVCATVCTWPARRPAPALLIALAAILLSILLVSRLRPDTSLEPMFSRDDPAGRAMLRVMNQFSAAEELIVMATAPHANPEALTAFAERLSSALDNSPAAAPLVASVTYRADEQTQRFFTEVLVPNGLFYLDDAEFEQAKQRLTREQMLEQFRRNEALVSAPGPAAQALSKTFLRDPLRLHEFILDRIASARPIETYKGSDAFISPDGRSILIRIAGNKPPSDIDFAKKLTRQITSIAQGVNHDNFQLDFTGSYAIATTAEAGIRRDMIATVTGSVILLQLLFVIVYRRPIRMFLLAFGPVAVGVLYGFASTAAFTHAYPHHRRHRRHPRRHGHRLHHPAPLALRPPAPSGPQRPRCRDDLHYPRRPRDLRRMCHEHSRLPAIGSSNVPALRDFAILGSLGLIGALIGTIFIMPAILVLTDREKSIAASRVKFDGVLDHLQRRRRIWMSFSIALLCACIVPLLTTRDWLPLESDLTVMHPRPNSPLDAERHIAERFGGSPGSLMIYLKAQTPQELVALAHDVKNRLSSDQVKTAGITGSFSLATLLPDPRLTPSRLSAIGEPTAQRILHDFNDVVDQTIFDPDGFEPYTQFLHHLLTRTTPPDITSLLPTAPHDCHPAKAAAAQSLPTESLMLVFAHGKSGRARHPREGGYSDSILPLRSPRRYPHRPNPSSSHNTEQITRRDLPRLVLIAAALAAGYLLLHFRNIPATLLALVPGIFGLLALLAFIRLSGQKLNMINLAALPLLIGIDVDYGIFLVHLALPPARKAQRAARATSPPPSWPSRSAPPRRFSASLRS